MTNLNLPMTPLKKHDWEQTCSISYQIAGRGGSIRHCFPIVAKHLTTSNENIYNTKTKNLYSYNLSVKK